MIYFLIFFILTFFVNKVFSIKNILNPFVYFFLFQTVFFFIALSYKDIYESIDISNNVIFIIIGSYFLTFLGAFFSRVFFSSINQSYSRFPKIKDNYTYNSFFFLSSLIIYLIGLLFYAIYFYKVGFLLFEADLENLRIEKRMNMGLITLLYINFLTVGFLGMYLSGLSKFKAILLFLLTGICLISFGSRAPIMVIFVGVLMISIVQKVRFNKKIRIRSLVIPILILFCFLIAFGAFRSGVFTDDILNLLVKRSGWRPFVNINNFQRIYDFFPNKHGFLLGETMLIDLKLFLPGSNPNFGTLLKDIMNWHFDGGSITASFIGLGYINFGYLGIFFYSIFYGLIFNTIYELYIYLGLNSQHSILFLMLSSITFAGSVSSGILSVILNSGMFFALILFIHYIIYLILKHIYNKY